MIFVIIVIIVIIVIATILGRLRRSEDHLREMQRTMRVIAAAQPREAAAKIDAEDGKTSKERREDSIVGYLIIGGIVVLIVIYLALR